ncbi:CBL-interacting serine/threonine-protein kinase 10-like [Malus sylvestris]|uniref:CBL-interacting serine/threonine-protein kinase 10-like n=1 Tax=Malus sylvestris TaxID=3752 RepID=UPI0021ABFF70|nr:CBL-interacting serine/threonine-protein kinase 10-like [Malus sylvestris]
MWMYVKSEDGKADVFAHHDGILSSFSPLRSMLKNGLLHTAYETLSYTIPEVVYWHGYDGSKADAWSCGVILFVLLTGRLLFDGSNLIAMYKKRKKHGKEADPVSFFHYCHTRKDNSWIDETSELTGATMEGYIQTMIESGQENSDDLRTRVYVKTMGPERHNRVRGYGHGVTPDMVSCAYYSASSSNSSRRSSRSSVAVLLTENNELRRKEEVNAKRVVELEVKLEETRNQ